MNKIFNFFINKWLETTYTSASVIVISIVNFLKLQIIKNIILPYPTIVIIIFTVQLIVLIWAFYYIYKLHTVRRKKIINRIAVDKKGECYCPVCLQYLSIVQDPQYKGQYPFYCKKCDIYHYPYLETSKHISAPQFHVFQKEHPQTIYTSKDAHLKVQEDLKKLGLM